MKINLENTNWNFPTPIRFGIDRVKELSLFIDELKISNPLIVTDPQFREVGQFKGIIDSLNNCLLYTSPSPRDLSTSRMPSSA